MEKTSLVDALHFALFPEEQDEVSDSIVESKERARAVSPMSREYIDEITNRRSLIGCEVPYLAQGTSTETLAFCLTLVKTHSDQELWALVNSENPWDYFKNRLRRQKIRSQQKAKGHSWE